MISLADKEGNICNVSKGLRLVASGPMIWISKKMVLVQARALTTRFIYICERKLQTSNTSYIFQSDAGDTTTLFWYHNDEAVHYISFHPTATTANGHETRWVSWRAKYIDVVEPKQSLSHYTVALVLFKIEWSSYHTACVLKLNWRGVRVQVNGCIRASRLFLWVRQSPFLWKRERQAKVLK